MSGDTIFLIASAAAFAGAWIYTRKGHALLPSAAPSDLASAMAALDDKAKARAYDAVSDKLVAHRAGKYESELLDALAPKGEAKP